MNTDTSNSSNSEEFNELGFSPAIYKALPKILQDVCSAFNSKVEKDAILLSSLVVISGCLPNVYSIYDSRRVYTNLYAFIVAPAGSGKGVIQFTRKLGEGIHKEMLQNNTKNRSEYNQSLAIYKSNKKQHILEELQLPSEPKDQLLFIPVNNSSSSLLFNLANSDGSGILFSTEADTLSITLKQDWGNFSDVLRAAFHHESISQQRRTNNELIEINCPKISVLLSGTEGQLFNLIPNIENGLFSRFIFFNLPSNILFKDVFIEKDDRIDKVFNQAGLTIHKYYKTLQGIDSSIKIQLTESSHIEILNFYMKTKSLLFSSIGESIIGTINRMALITVRLCMIITTLRHFEQGSIDNSVITCSDMDVNISIELAATLINNSTNILYNLKSNQSSIADHSNIAKLLSKLPDEFSKAQALEKAKELSISDSTVKRYLNNAIYFKKIKHAHYKKIKFN